MQFSKCQGFLILFFFMSTIMIFVLGLVVRILASIVQAEDPEEQIGQFMNLMHDTVNHKDHLVHKMLGEQFSDQLEQLRMATLSVFAAYPVVQSLLSPDGFAAIMALIGRNSQGKFLTAILHRGLRNDFTIYFFRFLFGLFFPFSTWTFFSL